VKILSHEHPVAGGEQVDVRIRHVLTQADEASPQHHMFQAGDSLAMASACATFINRIPGAAERALQEDAIQRTGKDRHVDFTRDQCIQCLRSIEIQKLSGRIQRFGSAQNLQDERSQGGAPLAYGKALAAELRKLRNGLGAPVEDEYRCIVDSAE